MIQLIHTLKTQLHELVGFTGYACMLLGVLMLLFSVLGGRIQGDKIIRAALFIVGGALLMNVVETYL